MPLLSFEQPEPRFNPPLRNWREDMPENNEPQLVPPQLHQLTALDDTYLELPRYSTQVIWIGILLCAVLSLLIDIGWLAFTILLTVKSGDYSFLAIGIVGAVLFTSMVLHCFKMYYCESRDQPIRFNRQRGKVYIFDYHRFYNPWRKWPVTITSYNWNEIHGEVCYAATRVDSGYQLHGTVCAPGTNNVTARFLIAKQSGEQAELSQLWSYLCQYMKGETMPVEPRKPGRPSDWCPRKADKWPADIEQESTTGPGSTITPQ